MFDNIPLKPMDNANSTGTSSAPNIPAAPQSSSQPVNAVQGLDQFQQKLDQLQQIGQSKGRRRNIIFIFVFFALFLLAGTSVYALKNYKKWLPKEERPKQSASDVALPVVCSEDTFVCPDGEVVKREGIGCQFTACKQAEQVVKQEVATPTDPLPIGTTCGLDGTSCEASTTKEASPELASTASQEEVVVPPNTTDPKKDTDNDNLADIDEIKYGTDKFNPDTDGDTYKDGDEIKNGYNPLGAGKLTK